MLKNTVFLYIYFSLKANLAEKGTKGNHKDSAVIALEKQVLQLRKRVDRLEKLMNEKSTELNLNSVDSSESIDSSAFTTAASSDIANSASLGDRTCMSISF